MSGERDGKKRGGGRPAPVTLAAEDVSRQRDLHVGARENLRDNSWYFSRQLCSVVEVCDAEQNGQRVGKGKRSCTLISSEGN